MTRATGPVRAWIGSMALVAVVLIGLNVGDIIVLSYNNTGANQAQNSFRLSFLTGNTMVFTSTSPPA